jgi:hypothetical protein
VPLRPLASAASARCSRRWLVASLLVVTSGRCSLVSEPDPQTSPPDQPLPGPGPEVEKGGIPTLALGEAHHLQLVALAQDRQVKLMPRHEQIEGQGVVGLVCLGDLAVAVHRHADRVPTAGYVLPFHHNTGP